MMESLRDLIRLETRLMQGKPWLIQAGGELTHPQAGLIQGNDELTHKLAG